MSTTRLTDVIEPAVFTQYIIENAVTKTRLFESGLIVPNEVMNSQLKAGAHSFNTPFWRDLGDDEANTTNDNPDDFAVPNKLNAAKQLVRKSFLHNSWSAANLASELAGDSAITRIKDRAAAYWGRQAQKRLIASLNGIKASNIANNDSDMVVDISAGAGSAAKFSASAVIDAIGTLGDSLEDIVAIAMHSDIYLQALKNDMIQTVADSQGQTFQTFRGLSVVVDDGIAKDATGNYTTVLFGQGAFGYGISEPTESAGTEIENKPSAGRGAGVQILHSRVNVAIHPSGFTWNEGTLTGESPTIAELADASHWSRIAADRKSVQLAFLVTK